MRPPRVLGCTEGTEEDAMSEIDREAEPFRWCVYCDADCDVDEPEHAAACPSTTGVYPVEREGPDKRPCEHCGKLPNVGFRCSDCDCLLGLGDHYTHRRIGDMSSPLTGGVEYPCYELICLGCAAQEALT